MDLLDIVQNITGFSSKDIDRAIQEEYALALINARKTLPQSKVVSIPNLIQ
jgi:hypothetical protein